MEVKQISVDLIDVFPLQVRKKFDEDKINELAESIKEIDVLNLPIVQRKGNRYSLIAGDRRVRATKKAGLKEIFVVIRDGLTDFEALLISGSENIQREDLTSVEREALIYQLWEMGVKENKFDSKAALARKIGLDPSRVTGIIRVHEFRSSAALDPNISTRAIQDTEGLEREERLRLLAKHNEGEIVASEIAAYVRAIKGASEPVKEILLEIGSMVTVAEAISIDSNLDTVQEKERALEILTGDKERRLEFILEIAKDRPRIPIMLDEIHTGYTWKCPICGENHHLIHVSGDKKHKHKFEKVVE